MALPACWHQSGTSTLPAELFEEELGIKNPQSVLRGFEGSKVHKGCLSLQLHKGRLHGNKKTRLVFFP